MSELPPPLRPLAWDRPQAPDAATVAARLREEGVEPYAWSNGPGDRYGVHEHPYAKLLMCAAGSITFLVGADAAAVTLGPGDGFVLPAGTPHAAVVGPPGAPVWRATERRTRRDHRPWRPLGRGPMLAIAAEPAPETHATHGGDLR